MIRSTMEWMTPPCKVLSVLYVVGVWAARFLICAWHHEVDWII